MKKFLLAAISFGLAFTFSACSDDSSSGTESENKSGETGDFGDFSTIDKDAEKILEDAVKGTDYESVTCDSVSTQIVAGTNYKFQCSIKDGKKTKDVVLTVFEPLPSSDKPVQLTLVTDADGEVLFESKVEFEAEDEESDDEKSDEGCAGCFGKFSAIDDDAEEVLKAAVKGSDYESVTCDSVSTQVVAGTNYMFQCTVKDGKKTKDVVLTVFEPLPNSDKPVQLTLVTDADGEVLFESKVEFEAEDEESDEGCDGCFGDYEELTEDDMDVFEKANKVSDSTFVNPTTVSKQVVAGMNYRFTCELQISDDETKEVVLEVYKNLEGEVEITSVAEVSEEPLQEKLDPSSFEIVPGAEGLVSDCGNSNGGAVTNCDVKLVHEN